MGSTAGPSRSPRRIVVGVDGSPASRRALREAHRLAQALKAPLVAVVCWSAPPAFDETFYPIDAETIRVNSGRLLESTVEEVFGRHRPAILSTRVVRGRPAAQLVEESQDAQLLVVGRRSTSGPLGTVLGSVSSAVIAHAKCPVLVVPY